MPCDACDIAKTTRAVFKGKIMTNMTVGSVWKTNISGKWATPSMQGKRFTLGFVERNSRKIYLYFSNKNNMFAQSKNPLKSEILKCPYDIIYRTLLFIVM